MRTSLPPKYLPKKLTGRKKVSLPVSWERLAQKYSKREMKKVYEVKSLSLSDLDNQEFIGLVGLHHSDLRIFAGKEAVEIGCRLRKEFWNRGYATEAAQACLDFAFQQAGLSEVYSFTSLHNLPSQKVMQKLGMEFVKEFDNEKVPADSPLYRHVLYRIKSFH